MGSGFRYRLADTRDPFADPCRPLPRQVRAVETPVVPHGPRLEVRQVAGLKIYQ